MGTVLTHEQWLNDNDLGEKWISQNLSGEEQTRLKNNPRLKKVFTRSGYEAYKKLKRQEKVAERTVNEWKKNKKIQNDLLNPSDYLHFWYEGFMKSVREDGIPNYSESFFKQRQIKATVKQLERIIRSTEKSFQMSKGSLGTVYQDNNGDIQVSQKDKTIYELFSHVYRLDNKPHNIKKELDAVTEDIANKMSGVVSKSLDVIFTKQDLTSSTSVHNVVQHSLKELGLGHWQNSGISGIDLAKKMHKVMQEQMDELMDFFNGPGVTDLIKIETINQLRSEIAAENTVGLSDTLSSIYDHDARKALDLAVGRAITKLKRNSKNKLIHLAPIFDKGADALKKNTQKYIRFQQMQKTLDSLGVQYDSATTDEERDEVAQYINAILAAYGGSFTATTGFQSEGVVGEVVGNHFSFMQNLNKGVFKAIETGGKGSGSSQLLIDAILSVDPSLKEKGNEFLARLEKDKEKVTRGQLKGDVSAVFGKDGCYSAIVFSVKKAHLDKQLDGSYSLNPDSKNIEIQSGSNLETYIDRAMMLGEHPGYVKGSLYSMLASHTDANSPDPDIKVFRSSTQYKNVANATFNSFKNFFLRALSFDFLTGRGEAVIDSATVMVLGGKMVPMYTIARQLASASNEKFNKMISCSIEIAGSSINKQWRDISREDFMAINQWDETNTDDQYFNFSHLEGVNRTAKFIGKITSAKISATINFNHITI